MSLPRATIHPATLRDASFVMANLRPSDVEEVMCQVPRETKRHELAYHMLQSREAWTAHLGERNPVALFGAQALTPAVVSIWAVGTKNMWRAIPAVTKHFQEDIIPRLRGEGFRMMEARSHVNHLVAHRWMVSTGAVQADQPYIYGRDGEKFITFRWTDQDFKRTPQTAEGAQNA